LLRESDFVTLHAPLSKQTYHMLGDEQFNRMKPGAILINTARGPIVDHAALYRALQDKKIAFAALDVTDPEPIPMDSPLLTLDNIIIVPHIASASIQTRTKMATMAAENLIAGLRGERLPNCVNPQVYSQTSQVPETSEALDAVARVRNQWSPVIQAAVAACQGNAQAAAQLAPFLDQMSQKDDWRALVAVLRRILAGERDPLALLPGLDDTDVIIAGDVLRSLGVDERSLPLSETGEPSEEGRWRGDEGHDDDDGDMVKLDDFLAMIVQACRPDAPPGLGEQLYNATRGMATHASAPSGIREMGRALNEILSGERAPDLSALPPQLADKVRSVLDALK
jgi:glyoxylate reductase